MGRQRNKTKKNLSRFETESLECRTSSKLGRHLVTKRNIKKGELLIKENWIVVGPMLNTKSLVCIGCHSTLSSLTSSPQLKCAECGWYVCSDACSKISPFHTSLECKFFVEKNIVVPLDVTFNNFGVLIVLRSMMLKLHNPEAWEGLTSLQSHNEQRKSLPTWKEDKKIVDLIRKTWNLADIFTADEILNICGILEVNSFEMGDMCTFGGIFLKSSMLSHDCIPNAAQNENIDDGCLEVIAILDIPSGFPVKVCYDASLEGTRWRQRELLKSKFFLCSCDRCTDPSELGTHFSSLLCSKCKRGYVTYSGNNNSHEGNEPWICSKCSFTMSDAEVNAICDQFINEAQEMDTTNVHMREDFLKKCKPIFHPNHFIPFRIKFNLCMAYGHEEGFSLSELTSLQVARKLEFCFAVLDVLDVICPGQSVARGNILYEIQAAQVWNAKQCLESERCTRRLIKYRLRAPVEALHAAIDIFQIHYPLRMLAKEAKEVTLWELTQWIRTL